MSAEVRYRVDIDEHAGEHSMASFQCLRNGAPGANLWHRDVAAGTVKYSADGNEAWILQNGLQSLSVSYTNGGSPTQPEFLFMDDFAYRWPYPVFSNPT